MTMAPCGLRWRRMSYRSIFFAALFVLGMPLASVACGGTAPPRTAATYLRSAEGPSKWKSACNVDPFWERASPQYEPCADDVNPAHPLTDPGPPRTEKHVAAATTSPSCGRNCRVDEELHAEPPSVVMPPSPPIV